MTKQHCPPLGWMLLDLSLAAVRRVAQMATDTCREWKQVCEEREKEESDESI